MKQYHKIQTIFKRDLENNNKTLLDGEYSLPEFDYLKDNQWVFTEKVDGTNIRIIYDDKGLVFRGKADTSQIPIKLLNRLNDIFLPLNSKFDEISNKSQVCLYGEGYGAKIQKGGGNYRSDQDFVIFDIKVGDFWLLREDVEDIAKKLGLDIVPIIGEGTIVEMIELAKRGFKSMWGDFKAEGIVARPKVELKTRNDDRVITKIKFKDFVV